MFYTYIIESVSKSWYYGHTNNVELRLHQHNTGQSKWTKGKGPWRVIFLRPFASNLEANRFELYLKKLKNKGYIKITFAQYFLIDAVR